jgi:hypothetical protein
MPVRLAVSAVIAADCRLDQARASGFRKCVAKVAGVRRERERTFVLAALPGRPEMTRNGVSNQRPQRLFVHTASE